MEKMMLNARLTRDDVIFSEDNASQTYIEECCIHELITSPDDIKSVIKNAFVKDIDLNRIRDWIQYFHDQDWLNSDLANDYLADLETQHKALYDALYHEVDTDEEDDREDEAAELGDLHPRPKADLNTMLTCLKPTQKATFDYCIKTLHSGTQLLAAMFGCAGTGKSHVLANLVAYMREVLHLNVAITAPTGVATWLVDETIVHHAFGLDHLLKTHLDACSVREAELANLDVLIIDECSMMIDQLFLNAQNLCWRVVCHQNLAKRFGGKHVIMFGDVAQLPPIGTTLFITALWKNNFKILLLKEIVR